jgi:membrane protein YqaA with SNARE-associated domain
VKLKLFQNIYERILKSCDSKYAPFILGFLSFTESCIFIIPPEILLLPMTYAKRKKAWLYAGITTVTSVIGAVAGYAIGHLLWDVMQEPLFRFIPGFASHFDYVGDLYQENVFSALFLAAFTPIPFKVFTVAAGVYSSKVSLFSLIWICTLGRGLRYFIMVGLIFAFGARAKEIIEKHFALVSLLGGIVIALGVYFLKFYGRH